MISTRINLPKDVQPFAQFVATSLDRSIADVYGALVVIAVTGSTPMDLKLAVEKSIWPLEQPKPKAVKSGKPKTAVK